jgi:hypothetical protein
MRRNVWELKKHMNESIEKWIHMQEIVYATRMFIIVMARIEAGCRIRR